MDFRHTTVVELAEGVRSGTRRAVDLVEHALERIVAVDGEVRAFVALDPDGARAAAAEVDRRVAAGDDPGPLAGIPIGVKDLEDAVGLPTSYGSAVYADGPPAQRDSVLVARLRAAGAVVVGKTNTPELGYQADTTNVPFGATRNPWDLTRSVGGSSGGSAAALAAGLVPLCTGSDGGGSIRIPSAVCGLSGLKPSLGRVPGGGPTPPGWGDLSTGGPMARRIADVAHALDAVVGPEPTDLRSLPAPGVRWAAAVADPRPPRRVAWSPTLGYGRVDAEVHRACAAAVARLADAGTEVVEVPSVFAEDPAGPWIRLAMAGNLRTLGHLEGTPGWDQLDPGHRRLIDAFGRVTGVELLEALDEAHRLNLRLVELFADVDLLLCPTVAGQVGPPGGQGTIDGEATFAWVSYTYPFNLTRSPAGTVCAGTTEGGLPVGLQVVGPQHADQAVLRAVACLEGLLDVDAVAPV